jgi:hypothetical protein
MRESSVAVGSGGWSQTRTVLVVGPAPDDVPIERQYEHAVVVSTPLELIQKLEDEQQAISTVVLIGRPEAHRELAAFLLDCYPAVRVLGVRYATDPEASSSLSPTYA